MPARLQSVTGLQLLLVATETAQLSGLCSFHTVRRLGLDQAITFAQRFCEQGLTCIP